MVRRDKAPDVVIVGGGMGGLMAALEAQDQGGRVLLLEKGTSCGGSLALSGGTLWCARTFEDLRHLVPHGDPELARTLVEGFMPGVEWLARRAELELLPSSPDRLVFLMKPNPREFVARMLAAFAAGGGELRRSTAGVRLVTEPNGSISGIIAGTADGLRLIPTRTVVLASGGFQANPEMRARYFGQFSDRLILRSNPHSTGDGWTMALGAGAAESRGMASFYGHLLPAPPAAVPTNDFIAYTQYHSEHSVLLNLRGERFTDESRGDETSSQATARQPEALAVLVFDEPIYRTGAVRAAGGGSRACDTFYESKALGARAAVTPTLDALAAEIEGWGVCGRAALASLREYNDAVARGAAAHLAVPRREKANPMAAPPFYALLVTPGITFTLGGLRIDSHSRVLHRGGWPVPGLYAAGADAGGIHNEQYAGGLCLGLVFGRRAAQHAVRYAKG